MSPAPQSGWGCPTVGRGWKCSRFDSACRAHEPTIAAGGWKWGFVTGRVSVGSMGERRDSVEMRKKGRENEREGGRRDVGERTRAIAEYEGW